MTKRYPTLDALRNRPRIPLGGAAALLLAGSLLAGCGGTSKAASTTPTGSASPQAGRPQRGAAPGTFGTAAEISGSTIQVQNPSTGQVSVTFTSTTRFVLTRTVTSAALRVGDCVTAIGARAANAPSAQASGSPAPESSPSAPKDFPAASVSISTPVNGSCPVGGGGFGGGGFGNGVRPSGAPSGVRPSGSRPPGTPGGNGGGFGAGFASGRLAAVTATSMSVQVVDRSTRATSTDTITLTASTTYSQTRTVTSTALRVGQCVAATGPADSKGAVAATRITLSTAGPNGCAAGFGRRGGANPSSSPTGG